jgi:hypothetical protein
VPRVAGIEDPTTYLLTENEESQKGVNSIPTKAHRSLPGPKFGSGACISSYTRAPHQLVLKTCDATRSHAPRATRHHIGRALRARLDKGFVRLNTGVCVTPLSTQCWL